MLISLANVTNYMRSEQRRGQWRKRTENQICAHLLLWKRFQYGSEPTPEEIAQRQLNERLALLESAPKVKAKYIPNPVIFGFGSFV
jgi:hypothetical protein